jgi:hypothetical protein
MPKVTPTPGRVSGAVGPLQISTAAVTEPPTMLGVQVTPSVLASARATCTLVRASGKSLGRRPAVPPSSRNTTPITSSPQNPQETTLGVSMERVSWARVRCACAA